MAPRAGIVWRGMTVITASLTVGLSGGCSPRTGNFRSRVYTPRKNFYTVSQISKFVRPGARRIAVRGSLGSLQLVVILPPGYRTDHPYGREPQFQFRKFVGHFGFASGRIPARSLLHRQQHQPCLSRLMPGHELCLFRPRAGRLRLYPRGSGSVQNPALSEYHRWIHQLHDLVVRIAGQLFPRNHHQPCHTRFLDNSDQCPATGGRPLQCPARSVRSATIFPSPALLTLRLKNRQKLFVTRGVCNHSRGCPVICRTETR